MSVYTVALVMVLVVSQQDQRRPVDAIVVLGAAQYNGRPSPVLRARLDHALRLYNEGYGSPGHRHRRRGPGRHDQRSHRGTTLSPGAPWGAAEIVVVQPQGRSTQASMTAVAEWLDAEGLHSVILVSDPFHMFRLRLEARRTNLEAYTSPTESSPISDNPVVELRYLAAEGFKIPLPGSRPPSRLSPLTRDVP